MNNEEALKRIVEEALTMAEKTGEFIVEQMPLVVQEFYVWRITSSCLMILLFAATIVLGWKMLKRVCFEGNIEEDGKSIFFAFFGALAVGLSPIFLISNIYNLLQILIAPRLYLIEYFTN